jgi:hypothetical protein
LELRCGGAGSSLHDENSYYVIRRFDHLAQREQMEDAYYASDDWRKDPREAILALIESDTGIVFELDEVAVQGCAGFSLTANSFHNKTIRETEDNTLVWHEFQPCELKFAQGESQHGRLIRCILVVRSNWTGYFLYGCRDIVMGDQQDSKQINLY